MTLGLLLNPDNNKNNKRYFFCVECILHQMLHSSKNILQQCQHLLCSLHWAYTQSNVLEPLILKDIFYYYYYYYRRWFFILNACREWQSSPNRANITNQTVAHRWSLHSTSIWLVSVVLDGTATTAGAALQAIILQFTSWSIQEKEKGKGRLGEKLIRASWLTPGGWQ